MHPARSVLLPLVVVAASVCGSAAAQEPQGASAPASARTTAPGGTTAADPAVPLNYEIGPNDRLRITVWNQADVSGEYAVSGDGTFTFPLIGQVKAIGLTVVKLEDELKRLLAAGYFRNPQVTVAVLDYRSKQIFMIGSLRTPGAYPLLGDIMLIEALARAGSTTGDAADHVFIIRSRNASGPVLPGEDASAEVTRVDLRALEAGRLPTAVVVRDGDTVFVPRASHVFVYGQVRSPGSYPIGQETTIRQALSLAGGVTDFGAVNRIRVLRVENGKEREIDVELNDVVKPADTIVVPERFF